MNVEGDFFSFSCFGAAVGGVAVIRFSPHRKINESGSDSKRKKIRIGWILMKDQTQRLFPFSFSPSCFIIGPDFRPCSCLK